MDILFYVVAIGILAFALPWMVTYGASVFSAIGALFWSVVEWFQGWMVPEASPNFRTDRSSLNAFEVFGYKPDAATKARDHHARKHARQLRSFEKKNIAGRDAETGLMP